ncbi:MAG TPA: single-stranded-DNA-specific exonuclease RecJ [Flavobacteriales bacterium]|nr:single-stranded-DNA-specific exonuclease RecJ [Flavobacteriales bacterium]
MEKRWLIKDEAVQNVQSVLTEELKISPLLAALLSRRGVSSFEEAREFFRPELSMLHDPFLMQDMDLAIERIEAALESDERIMIYGDYDVDGTTSVALVFSFFNKLYENMEYYIPDRYDEGYGVSTQGIDYAAKQGVSLIICLDCGIKANEKIAYAKEQNIDFIVCDHHTPGDELPPAVAVLDPKRSDCSYPYDELSGCGIGFKLVQAYASKNEIPFEELKQYLDLTAISIASDIVPITGENRVLAHYGLELINSDPRPGIKALLELNNINKTLYVSNLVFIIGPRINAAGRIESGKSAVKLLISNDMEAAMNTSKRINENNLERRKHDSQITKEALKMIEQSEQFQQKKTTVLFKENWHKGVIGIVASRLIERHYKPTIVLTESHGKATGSARSVDGYNVYNAINSCSDLLEQFGGHKYAAGLTMKIENIEAFSAKFEEYVNKTIEEHQLIPTIEIDAEIEFGEITRQFFRILKQFEPFGPQNMTPVFLTKGVLDNGQVRIVGEKHLKLFLHHPSSPNVHFSAIAFGQSQWLEPIANGETVDICYTIEENEWNGNVSLQLNIKDIRR